MSEKITKLYDLESWLVNNFQKLEVSIEKTNCHKWKKWYYQNEVPFPCVCPLREKSCIFIEAYYKIDKAKQLVQNESKYLSALVFLSKLNKEQLNSVYEWIKDYQKLGEELIHFEPIIKIALNKEPYEYWKIILPKEKFSNLLKFKKAFNEYYYSKGYEDY